MKYAKCKYCGYDMLAWYQTKKGKWLLVETAIDDYKDVVIRTHPHSKLPILHKCLSQEIINGVLNE